MQTYLEKDEKCKPKWVRGVIGPDVPLAKKILLTRFAEYKNTARYRDMQEFLASQAFQFTCDCDSRFCSTAGHHTVRGQQSFRIPMGEDKDVHTRLQI